MNTFLRVIGEIVKELPNEFESHDVINKLISDYSALYEQNKGNRSDAQYNGWIANQLFNFATPIDKVDSCGGYIPRRLRRNKGMYPTAIPCFFRNH